MGASIPDFAPSGIFTDQMKIDAGMYPYVICEYCKSAIIHNDGCHCKNCGAPLDKETGNSFKR